MEPHSVLIKVSPQSHFILSPVDSRMLRSGTLAWFQGGSPSNNRPSLLRNHGLQHERRLLEDSAKNEKEMKRVSKWRGLPLARPSFPPHGVRIEHPVRHRWFTSKIATATFQMQGELTKMTMILLTILKPPLKTRSSR